MASFLKLRKQPFDIDVTGIHLSGTEHSHSVDTKIKSRFNKYEKHLSFLLISDITGILPLRPMERDLLKIPENIKLADPEFNKPAETDALIGVQIFYKLLCRCTVVSDSSEIQLHGFRDAREKEYGACIYLHSADKYGHHHSSLVCSKSRVAPIHTVSLPRLELYAVLLLARLYTATSQALLQLSISKVVFWSDSMIVLHWIKESPHTLITFEANRVAEIQEATRPFRWKHVSTKDNPADFSSRGRMPREFLDDHLWHQGPSWLTQSEDSWPHHILKLCQLPELRKVLEGDVAMTIASYDVNLSTRFSSMRTMTHVLAYCSRFCDNAKPANTKNVVGPLAQVEIQDELIEVLKIVQTNTFSDNIKALRQKGALNKKSKTLTINPFLEQGILKVGGSLVFSDLHYDQKHPILPPRNNHVTELYWILDGTKFHA
ncbi:uncharacterized protein LOC117173701 [Belonocnema kinseyi]|uniref:uncharacterized protein LOC117173701 n=1 Tax=Belonocnema kinseyi TaxID=2817044 RepID=UPI00143D7AAD|nr:uncharacterized protein LOC117173701 [Belonocnema kinseyi]